MKNKLKRYINVETGLMKLLFEDPGKGWKKLSESEWNLYCKVVDYYFPLRLEQWKQEQVN